MPEGGPPPTRNGAGSPAGFAKSSIEAAAQLARLTSDRLECDPACGRAPSTPRRCARTSSTGDSQNGLWARVKDIPGEPDSVSGAEMASAVRKVEELPEADPADKRHLFYEEMKRSLYATWEIEPEDLGHESFNQFMGAAGQLSNAIRTIAMRRRRWEEDGAKALNLSVASVKNLRESLLGNISG